MCPGLQNCFLLKMFTKSGFAQFEHAGTSMNQAKLDHFGILNMLKFGIAPRKVVEWKSWNGNLNFSKKMPNRTMEK